MKRVDVELLGQASRIARSIDPSFTPVGSHEVPPVRLDAIAGAPPP